MINENRIVPITAVDLISMYGLILKLNNNFSNVLALQADTVDGQFSISEANNLYLASEPVKSIDFESAALSSAVFFVPAYDFEGFTVDGVSVTPSINTIDGKMVADGHTLYMVTHPTAEAVNVSKYGF